MTIERRGVKSTIMANVSSPTRFIAVERDLGRNTILLFCQEITEEEYEENSYYFFKPLP
jgi:hypothetical protein